MSKMIGSGAISVDLRTGEIELTVREAESLKVAKASMRTAYDEAIEYGGHYDGIPDQGDSGNYAGIRTSMIPYVIHQAVIYWHDELIIMLVTNGEDVVVEDFNDVIQEKIVWHNDEERQRRARAPKPPEKSQLWNEIQQLSDEANNGENNKEPLSGWALYAIFLVVGWACLLIFS